MKQGEEAFLDWVRKTRQRARDLTIPIGDDAAVIRWDAGYDLVVTADAIAEGSHFVPEDPPALVGRKALAVNLSDIAAMGAEPRFAFATAALPRGFAPRLPRAVTLGMRRLAAEHGVVLAGGDTITHAGGLVISVTLVGRVRTGRAVPRGGARVGDVIAVTGALGGSLAKGRHLRFQPRVAEGRTLARLGPPSAMMDVSDGLLLDLHRLATMSGVGARVFADRVPVHRDAGKDRNRALDRALSEGEDFELLFTMEPARFRALSRSWRLRTPITAIGEVVARGLFLVRGGVEGGRGRVGSSIVERKLVARSQQALESIAAGVARGLLGGDRIALYGDLGAGKTAFVRGLARGLGHPDPREVVSPTFAIHNRYEGGRVTLDHLDLYRLAPPVSLVREGLEVVLADPDNVVCVEWAERLAEPLPGLGLEVRLAFVDPDTRSITLAASVRAAKRLLGREV